MDAQKTPLTPREYGRRLAEQAPPISPEQAHAAARILANVPPQAAVDHDAA